MEEWKEYQIADICKIKHGFAFKGQYFTDCKQPYVCITPGNFAIKGGFKLNKPKYYNGPIPENYILHANDLIITMTDLSKEGDTLGYSALVPQSSDYIFLHNQRIGLVEEINDKIDKHFLYWIMRTYDYQKYIVKHCSGSTVKHTSPNNIGSYFFKAPSLKKQKDIASILDNFEAKIELNRRINANLEAQAQALFRSWFVDFEPFRDGPFVDSELGKIPQGWEIGTLSEIADITMGQSPKGSSYNEEGNGIIFYQGRAEFGNRFPSIRLYTTEPTRIAEINSVLLSVRAPVGDINIAKNTCCIGRGLAAIKSKHGCNSFILYLLQSLKPLLEQYNGEGTVFGCINRKEIEGLPIIIPKESVINEFEEIVEKIDSEIKNLTIEQENLSALRDTLLPKLMAGEIKI